jgi:glycosyltransferase involved in cell wall biosynthesis
MASGCALVASNVEGTRDLVRDNETGLLFEFQNEANLMEKVLALIDDAPRRRKLAHDASHWVRSNMSIEASAARMGEIYDEYLLKKGVIAAARTPRTSP